VPENEGGAQQTFGAIEPIEIQEEMERSFLDYAMSVITARALPDARDGLKPVHRRILFDMNVQNFRPDRPHVKCAKVSGDTMSRFHPHGNSAIYDALVRMAQPFSLRHPLIDFHGNYGSPDYPAAAERYCVVGETMVRTIDGTRRIDSLVALEPDSEADIDVKVVDHHGVPVRATKVFHSGTHPVFRLETREGYSITGTANHPLLCLEQVAGVPMLLWRRLDEIGENDVVVVSRHIDEFSSEGTGSDALAGMLAGAFVAEGFVSDRRAGFNNTDPAFFELVVDAYDRLVGGTRYVSHRVIASGSVLWELDVQDLGPLRESPLACMVGLRSAAKVVPEFVWNGPRAMKRAFLQAVFEGDGCVSAGAGSTTRIFYSSYSEGLVRDLQRLLLEFGIISRLRFQASRGEWKLSINNRRDVRSFQRYVGFLTEKRGQLIDALETVPLSSRALSSDHVPYLAEYVRRDAPRGNREWLSHRNIDRFERWERDGDEIRRRIASEEILRVIEPVLDPGLYFARVASVGAAGNAPVYSVHVDADHHAFLAGGFVNHNTECRLSQLAMHMLAGLDEDTVDMVANYANDEEEPVVLPARFPNLLVNGSQGIAVGMATNIPPHNLGEVIDATVHLIDNPEATPDDLMQIVKGPDFPTGGYILGRAGILDAYRTGRGSIRMRANCEIEETKTGVAIVVTELPYQVSAATVLSRIKDLVDARELDGIRDLDDLSAGDETRLVVSLKRDANANVVLNNLYKHTTLQTSFGVNMVALVDGVPRTLNLVQMLQAYIAHQVEVIRRRSEHRLKKARERAHLVEGRLKALDHIDAIIALIRGSEDRDAAKTGLMAAPFEFSELQATDILDMRLSQLTRLGRTDLEKEMAELRTTIAELESILADPVKLRGVIKSELAEIREKFAEPRRSEITFDPGDLDVLDLIEDEEIVVVLSHKGYVKTVASDAFRRQARGGKGVAGAKLKDEDWVEHLLTTTAHSYLLFFSNRGRVYRLRAHEIPMKERTARGTALVNLIALQPDERIQAVIDTRTYEEGSYLFFATRMGVVKKTKMSEYDSSLRTGLIAINLRDEDELVRVVQTTGSDSMFMVSRNGMTIRFSEDDVRPMGRATAGVRGMKLKNADDAVVSCDVARDESEILFVTKGGYGKRTRLDRFNTQGRGGQGVRGMKVTPQRGEVVASFMISAGEEILVFSSAGNIIRMEASEISAQGRDATGVRVARVLPGESVVAVAPVLDSGVEE